MTLAIVAKCLGLLMVSCAKYSLLCSSESAITAIARSIPTRGSRMKLAQSIAFYAAGYFVLMVLLLRGLFPKR
jgi:hypothetical protein